MSKNIFQVYQGNPIVTNQATDLMYFGRAPYGLGDDTAMEFSDFAAQFGAAYTPSALTKTDDTNITLTLGGTPNIALLQPVSLTLGWTGLLAIARGGTGVGSVTTVPTATAFAGWDANSNLSANNFLEGTALVTNSGGTTTLTVSSSGQYIFSGATFETVQLPVVATLATGTAYRLVNDSSNALFVISSGSNAVLTMQPLTSAVFTFNGTAGTTAASWSVDYTSNTIGVQSITGTVNQIIASSPTGNLTLSLPQDIATTSSPTFAALTLTNPLTVPNGGSGASSFTAYAVLCGGTTSTSPFQSVASVGSSGEVLTSNGPGALPTFQSVPGGGTPGGTNGQIQYNNSGVFGGDSGFTTDGNGGLNVVSDAMTVGNTRTNATTKQWRMRIPNYNNADGYFGYIFAQSTNTNNSVNIGGGSSLINSATLINFVCAANTTTPTGTSVGDFTINGFRLGGANSRVTTILNDNTMAAASGTNLYTGGAIKGYVDAKFETGAVKAWAVFDISGGIIQAYNVISITDSGTGVAAVNFNTSFSSANYSVSLAAQGPAPRIMQVSNTGGTVTAAACTCVCVDAAGSLTDPALWRFAAYGDQ